MTYLLLGTIGNSIRVSIALVVAVVAQVENHYCTNFDGLPFKCSAARETLVGLIQQTQNYIVLLLHIIFLI